ncbi:MAG: hypothetical protein AAB308_17650, partial [Nitrospirota bacterium]
MYGAVTPRIPSLGLPRATFAFERGTFHERNGIEDARTLHILRPQGTQLRILRAIVGVTGTDDFP